MDGDKRSGMKQKAAVAEQAEDLANDNGDKRLIQRSGTFCGLTRYTHLGVAVVLASSSRLPMIYHNKHYYHSSERFVMHIRS